MNKQQILKKLAEARDISSDLEIYGPIMDAIAFIENVPEWVDFSQRMPEKFGWFNCSLKSGCEVVLRWAGDCFIDTYDQCIDDVVKWSLIYVPEVV